MPATLPFARRLFDLAQACNLCTVIYALCQLFVMPSCADPLNHAAGKAHCKGLGGGGDQGVLRGYTPVSLRGPGSSLHAGLLLPPPHTHTHTVALL